MATLAADICLFYYAEVVLKYRVFRPHSLLLVTNVRCFAKFKRETDMKKALLIIAICGVILSPVLVQAARKSKKSKKAELEKGLDDKALGDAVFLQLKAAVEGGGYEEAALLIVGAIKGRLACGHLDDLDGLSDMALYWHVCMVFGDLEKLKGGSAVTEWLVGHREFIPALVCELFTRPSQEPHINKMLRFGELIKANEKAVLEYPNLAIAFATTRPMKNVFDQPTPCTMVDAFRYYTDGKTSFRNDLKKLPISLLRYLADSRLSIAERKWAVKTYGKHRDLLKTFRGFEAESPKKKAVKLKEREVRPLSSINASGGGSGVERAYYTSELCKALGQPATIALGYLDAGGALLWPVALVGGKGGKSPSWDTMHGKQYRKAFSKVFIMDPVGRVMPEDQLLVDVGLATLPQKRQAEAVAACILAAQVQADSPDTVNLKRLESLVREYNSYIAENDKEKTPIDFEQFKLVDEYDIDMAMDLLKVALGRNFVSVLAWSHVVAACKSETMPRKRLNAFVDILLKKTGKVIPLRSCNWIITIAQTMEKSADKQKLYKLALAAFKKDTFIPGWLMIALGDDYLEQGKKKKALKVYQRTALKYAKVAGICLFASGKAEQVLVDAGQAGRAIEMYKTLMNKTASYRSLAVNEKASSYYLIGLRLIKLYESVGKDKEARRIRAKIGEKS